jgi:hypothetical protein
VSSVLVAVTVVGVIILFTPILVLAYIATSVDRWMNAKQEGYDNE